MGKYDPEIIRREYPIKKLRADYALFTVGTTPVIIVEVKAIGQSTGGDKQLFECAFHEGVPMAVLSDGREWSFYLPGEHGRYEDWHVDKLDLLERDVRETCQILQRYLEFERVKSGRAMKDARNDYKDASQKRQAEGAIPKAWQDIVEEPDELFIELLVEKTESICGFRPEVKQIKEFIVKTLIEKHIPHSDTVSPPTKPSIVGSEMTVPRLGSKEISYCLFGTTKTTKTAKDAYLEILRKMATRDSEFCEKLSKKIPGRTRNPLARTRREINPKRPDLTKNAVELLSGWWIDTNVSNDDKLCNLKRACEVINIEYGKDLVVKFSKKNLIQKFTIR